MGAKKTVGYHYYTGLHFILASGVPDKIARIRVDELDIFEGELSGGSLSVDEKTLFGGDSKEGGVKGTLDFETGLTTQIQNSYLLDLFGVYTPAFRGVAGVVLRQMYLGNSPYLKKWDFKLQRIHIAQDDAEQWNNPFSEIALDYLTEISNIYPWDVANSSPENPSFQSFVVNEGGSVLETYDVNLKGKIEKRPYTGSTPVAGTVVEGGAPAPGSNYNVLRLIVSSPAKTYYLNSGIEEDILESVDTTFQIEANPDATLEIAYQTTSNFVIGLDQYFSITCDEKAVHTRIKAARQHGAMNPAHIIRECLTNADWGMGYASDDIDEDSFLSTATVLFAESFGLCFLWNKQSTIEKFINEVTQHINAQVYVDRTTGKFKIVLIREDYDVDSLLVLDSSNVQKVTDYQRPAFGELVNSVTLNYPNLKYDDVSTIAVSDSALIQQQENEISKNVTYDGIPNASLAATIAKRDLLLFSSPLISCTVHANSAADVLNVGSVFKLTWAKYGADELIFRVMDIDSGDGIKNTIRMNCVQDVFSLPDALGYTELDLEWIEPIQPPSIVVNQISLELPYRTLVEQYSKTTIDLKLEADETIGYMSAAASRPAGDSQFAKLFTNLGVSYNEVAKIDYCPYAEMASSVTKISTSFTIENELEIDDLEVDTIFQIDDELMAFVSLVGDLLTVKRGVLDTAVVDHFSGSKVYFWGDFPDGDLTEYIEADSLDIKLANVSGGGENALVDCAETSLTFDKRAIRPFLPGDLQFDGGHLTYYVGENVAITWKHRNRLTQSSGVIVDFQDGTITPEVGTSYTILLKDEFGVLITTYGPFTSESYTMKLPAIGKYIIEVMTYRDSIRSFQIHTHNVFWNV